MALSDLNKVSIKIEIGGKECDFSTLKLHQTMFGHHSFRIEINCRAKKDELWRDNAGELFDWLGESINIKLTETSGASTDFEGFISRVNVTGDNGDQGTIELYGGSPTMLMIDDLSMMSFTDFDLSTIVFQTLNDLGIKISHKIEPHNNSIIPYVCRYKESSYGFLRRLLTDCGEWFYYDGKKIVVGDKCDDSRDNEVELFYKRDLTSMNISAKAGNFRVEQYDYDASSDKVHQWFAMPRPGDYDSYLRKAFEKSEPMFKGNTLLPSSIPVVHGTTFILENSVAADHYRKLAGNSLFEAKTNTCKVALGKVIRVNLSPDGRQPVMPFGHFRVIDIEHTYDDNKKTYENTLRGISSDVKFMPSGDVAHPTAFPEVAKVIDNNDPTKMGRVKVKFIWQSLNEHPQDMSSGWIRVQSPDAGSSDMVQRNRGFFFIPEIDDQVMVGYELGDPNRPFVMGSLFHSNNSQGISDNNKLKSITTRSGSTLTIDDDAHTILLCTSNSNQIFINEKKGVITIKALDEINISSKNINIEASENMNISVGKQIETNIGGNSLETVGSNKSVSVYGNMETNIEKDLNFQICGNFSQTIFGDFESSMSNFEVEASGKAQIASSGKLTLASGDKVNVSQG